MELLSVNVGVPRQNPWKRDPQLTGIDKRPADGPIAVTAPGPKGTGAVGLAGDRVYDVKHHGGDDQAVYAYAREDLDYWETRLGRALPCGVFGENLTTRGLDVNGALIGERWRIGSTVVLEVSCPRIPCGTFRGWIAERGWLKTFTAERRAGAYLRVVEPGDISAGDRVEVISRPDHDVSVALTFRAIHDHALLPRLSAADALPSELRELAREHRA
ncbi:MAG TPA: MOSC domain-containing protein [Stackebrandtia sp.]|uniref:MOSC domain-containing protein n=1 Tax=Stackebrandtia sp. TaxID=2023065 RepID=UPI002D56BE0B|nr:MOSC domain-containing protein [Stackebrandtia sp.]HZE41484.1 MOSC domain-containing protein [Stackebrandtia sp.]